MNLLAITFLCRLLPSLALAWLPREEVPVGGEVTGVRVKSFQILGAFRGMGLPWRLAPQKAEDHASASFPNISGSLSARTAALLPLRVGRNTVDRVGALPPLRQGPPARHLGSVVKAVVRRLTP